MGENVDSRDDDLVGPMAMEEEEPPCPLLNNQKPPEQVGVPEADEGMPVDNGNPGEEEEDNVLEADEGLLMVMENGNSGDEEEEEGGDNGAVAIAPRRVIFDLPPNEEVIARPLTRDLILSYCDYNTLLTLRLVSKNMEQLATEELNRRENHFLNLQEIHSCCRIGPVPQLFNPRLAAKIMSADNCRRTNPPHPTHISIMATSEMFMRFCLQYNCDIETIYYISPEDQYSPLKAIITHLALPNLKAVIMEVTNATPRNLYERMFEFNEKPTIQYLEVQKKRGFRPSATLALFDNLIISAINLRKLVIGDYLYPQFTRHAYSNLTELVYNIGTYLIHNQRRVSHDLFLPEEIRRIVRELANSLQRLTLISDEPLNYGDLYGHISYYNCFADPGPVTPLLPRMPRLKFLHLQHNDFFVLTPAELSSQNLPSLKTCKISRAIGRNGHLANLFVTAQFLGNNFSGNTTLTKLDLDGIDSLTTIAVIRRQFPALADLTINLELNTNDPWSVEQIFRQLSLYTLRNLKLEFPMTLSFPQVAHAMWTVYYERNVGPVFPKFFGLESCLIRGKSFVSADFDDFEFDAFTGFLSVASRDMKRLEFQNFHAPIGTSFRIKEFIIAHNLPVFFTNAD